MDFDFVGRSNILPSAKASSSTKYSSNKHGKNEETATKIVALYKQDSPSLLWRQLSQLGSLEVSLNRHDLHRIRSRLIDFDAQAMITPKSFDHNRVHMKDPESRTRTLLFY